MANRDVGISICGVVVGVLLGAGSVLYAQDATLGASSTDVAFREAPNASEYKARTVERNAREVFRDDLKNIRRPAKRGESETAVHEAAVVDSSDCGIAKSVTEEYRATLNAIIPHEQEFEKFTKKLVQNLDDTVRSYCGEPVEVPAVQVETETEETSKSVDNNCERFAGTSQQAKCEGNQVRGRAYKGR